MFETLASNVFLASVLMVCVAGFDNLIPASYLKHVRPKPQGGGPVKVGVSWHLSRIHHVDTDGMYLDMSMRPSIAWLDDRIHYLGENHTGDHEELLPLTLEFLQQTWKPDLFFLDTRDMKRFSMVDEVAGLWLLRNKTFILSFLTKISVDCPMQFAAYPFDVQICPLTMVSYEYNKNDLSLNWFSQGITASHRLGDQLTSYYISVLPGNITTHAWCHECFLEPTSAVTSALRLERRYMAFLLTIYIPSFLFVAVSWISFFWPPEPIPGRTVLVITSLLTVVSMYASVRQSSPKTDYAKATDVWFFVCICFNVSTLFEFACVIWMRRQHNKLSKTSAVTVPQKPAPFSSAGVSGRNQVAEHLVKLQIREEKLESISRMMFPFLFLVFNLIYWPVYLTNAG